MKKIAGICFMMMFFVSCNAQTYRIQKAWAFYTVTIPGMAMRDENGNRINPEPVINRFIYIECRYNAKPKIDSVYYNTILFAASVADKEESIQKIGVRNNDGQPVMINSKKGNHVWKITLTQQGDDKGLTHEAIKKITIKGRLDKVKFSHFVNEEIQLSVPDSQ
jgi:hypothetical protein